VPFIIGVNWFIVMYCCGVSILALYNRLTRNLEEPVRPKPMMKMASVISDGALLAVFFDWIMEPAAIALGYWSWQDSEIPMFNYISWLIVSAVLLVIFHICKFDKRNKFAVNLLLIQFMFFLLLRSLL
jgi:putative membrane protein